MKKLVAFFAFPIVLASSAFAETVVASPPAIDTSGWKKLEDVTYCKVSRVRVHIESFVLSDKVNGVHLYERKTENGRLMGVRDMEMKEGKLLHDDFYLYKDKWTKHDLRTEPEVFMEQIAQNRAPQVTCPKVI